MHFSGAAGNQAPSLQTPSCPLLFPNFVQAPSYLMFDSWPALCLLASPVLRGLSCPLPCLGAEVRAKGHKVWRTPPQLELRQAALSDVNGVGQSHHAAVHTCRVHTQSFMSPCGDISPTRGPGPGKKAAYMFLPPPSCAWTSTAQASTQVHLTRTVFLSLFSSPSTLIGKVQEVKARLSCSSVQAKSYKPMGISFSSPLPPFPPHAQPPLPHKRRLYPWNSLNPHACTPPAASPTHPVHVAS